MSWVNATSRVTCDAGDDFKMCRRFVQAASLQAPDEVRMSARLVGWCCLVVSEIDYCPRHSPPVGRFVVTSTERLTLPEALGLLADLGHWTQVADYLAKAKVQGVPGSPCKCPLAQWLMQVTGEPSSVTYLGMALLATQGRLGEVRRIPEMVGDFVWRFDEGQFPALIAPKVAT